MVMPVLMSVTGLYLRGSRRNGRHKAGVTPHSVLPHPGPSLRCTDLTYHNTIITSHQRIVRRNTPSNRACRLIFDGSLLDVFHGPSTHPPLPPTGRRPSSLARPRVAPSFIASMVDRVLPSLPQRSQADSRPVLALSRSRRCCPVRGVPACMFETRGEMGGPGGRPSLSSALLAAASREERGWRENEAWVAGWLPHAKRQQMADRFCCAVVFVIRRCTFLVPDGSITAPGLTVRYSGLDVSSTITCNADG
ncbi:hypothetical protein CSOJ01_03845 [Colletotrichum sojae]|uniref:Uncharacterized protein n=1 Tax=Colletotrichum sojae TaxID=2175907 RepID=A0A8H6MZJ0_9PEZI|nr:hypothetical protein CSOJ01_03845 [Colletotrichum sojae]